MLRAVIFDFDGVITDSEILHLRAFNKVLARYSVEITKQDYYKEYLGMTDRDCFKFLMEKGLLKIDGHELESLIERKNEIFEGLAKGDGRIIEGVRDFLEMLRRNQIPMAICSGALLVEIELILEQAKLHDFFCVIVSAEQVKKSKPNPEGFLLTLHKLNDKTAGVIEPQECVVIEDSHWGLEAARTAGMHRIAVTNSYEAEELAPAEKIVKRLDDLDMTDLEEMCA